MKILNLQVPFFTCCKLMHIFTITKEGFYIVNSSVTFLWMLYWPLPKGIIHMIGSGFILCFKYGENIFLSRNLCLVGFSLISWNWWTNRLYVTYLTATGRTIATNSNIWSGAKSSHFLKIRPTETTTTQPYVTRLRVKTQKELTPR